MTTLSPTPRPASPSRSDFRWWWEMKARNRDTDQFGHVNHASMATFFEEGRIGLVFAPETAGETRGRDLLVANLTMTFHRELCAPGAIEVGSCVTRIGSSSLDIRQGVFAGDVCYASALASCVLINARTRRPERIADALRALWLDATPQR